MPFLASTPFKSSAPDSRLGASVGSFEPSSESQGDVDDTAMEGVQFSEVSTQMFQLRKGVAKPISMMLSGSSMNSSGPRAAGLALGHCLHSSPGGLGTASDTQPHPPGGSVPEAQPASPMTPIEHAMSELVESEQRYFLYLKTAERLVLQVFEPALSAEDVKGLLTPLREVLVLTKHLSRALVHYYEAQWKPLPPDKRQIGRFILGMLSAMYPLLGYIRSYEITQHRLGTLARNANYRKHNQEFARLWSEQPSFGGRQLQLESVLVMPVQRLPRYRLLVESIAKHTPTTHTDAGPLRIAIERIHSLTVSVNTAISHAKNIQGQLYVHSKLIPIPTELRLSRTRSLIRDEVLCKMCRKGPKPRWFLLFSDLIVYAQPVTGSFGALWSCSAISALTEICALAQPADCYENKAFVLQSPRKSFIVIADTTSIRDRWVDDINTASTKTEKPDEDGDRAPAQASGTLGHLGDAPTAQTESGRSGGAGSASRSSSMQTGQAAGAPKPPGKAGAGELAPVWVPDMASTACMRCGSRFTLIRRRHHCRVCGLLTCGVCAPTVGAEVASQYGINTSVRICGECRKAKCSSVQE